MSSLITRRCQSPTARTVRLTYRCRVLAWMDPRRDGRIWGLAYFCLTTTEAAHPSRALCERVGGQTQFLGSDKFLGKREAAPQLSVERSDLCGAACGFGG